MNYIKVLVIWIPCTKAAIFQPVFLRYTYVFYFIERFVCLRVCVCARVYSVWVQILHSAEEDNLSPFDLNIACLCQSQVRKPIGSGVEWAECSLIIGTGCRGQVFSLILDSSVGLSVRIQSAGDLVSETLGSNPAFSRGRQLVSFRFEYRLPVPEYWN